MANKQEMFEQDDIDEVQEAQESLQKDVSKLRCMVKEMRAQNTRLESMLTALLTSQDITWQEEDFQDGEAS